MAKNKQVKISYTNTEDDFDTLYNALCDHYEDMGINNIEWSGAGFDECPGLTSELIEKYLYEKGECALFEDLSKGGYFNLPFTIAGGLNVYKQPGKINVIGNGYSKTRELGINAVRIKNNSLGKPTKTLVDFYVRKMVDIIMTKTLRMNAHKTPFMLETSPDAVLSAKNMFKDIKASEPVIYKNKTRGEGEVGIGVLNTDIEYMNDRLDDEFNTYDARILNLLGIDNYVEDKKERVQSAEVEANAEADEQSFSTRLEAREKACEEIEKVLGLHFEVKYSNKKPSAKKPEDKKEDDINE